ncbi:hypothetical protein AVEN_172893-1 [Araneus ventricosus]|uniref:HTH psq-type domain-containing protein n=1 Tax=Araneus ventricosus TaxID=182803 RepID=A0A4Y2MLX7_ARAVE|nr:hypothetical protein AVEN_140293-1 [Araneus ventricosus]GBN07325.1 hypothetical protein AVEN_95727-1 [Araneus ventricosus]GBN25835.1 hypothetical protein AVEN_188481-1 [Araneus ventricosus]GBN27549.1 hypothetical protein AVEN_172893-1 [Araneus ventricosus]
MPRNPDGIKRSKPNADSATAAAETVLKDGAPVRTAALQFGQSRTTLQRHIDSCREANSENMELNCTYSNRCAVWTQKFKEKLLDKEISVALILKSPEIKINSIMMVLANILISYN